MSQLRAEPAYQTPMTRPTAHTRSPSHAIVANNPTDSSVGPMRLGLALIEVDASVDVLMISGSINYNPISMHSAQRGAPQLTRT
jgi:hypothetical protein